MIIPIGTDIRLREPPVGNWVLIGANVFVYVIVNLFQNRFAEHLLPPLHAGVPSLFEYISYQFRHGDWLHLAGNMLFLWVFGNAVCARMGSLNYVLFYLAGGVFAGWVFAATNANPLVGASGAIAAVTTTFLVLFPRVHVTILLWILIITTIQLPSMFFIVFKIILWDNIIAPSFERGMTSNVAFSAHLGGYAFGFVVALGMLALRGLPRDQFDLLAIWKRWQRRTGVRGERDFGGPRSARPIVVEEVESRPLKPLKLTPAEQLREDIVDRLSEHDVDEAVRLYRQLLELDAEQVLPRPQQLEIANHLAQLRQYDAAVQAYAAYLEAYPTAADVAQVRLYAGLIYRRYLGDARRAAGHLRAALEGLALESQREFALRELQAAEADISGPTTEEPGGSSRI
jgi:membrane associated rhomboid family serine protease